MKRLLAALLVAPLLLATVQPASAQYGHRRNDDYNSVYQGGRSGRYDDNRRGRYNDQYDRQYRDGQYPDSQYPGEYDERYRRNPGGIGPGKGAVIGGAGGAAIGLIFGGGLRGAIIGGAAGAGIGAVAGKANQNRRRNRDDRYDPYQPY